MSACRIGLRKIGSGQRRQNGDTRVRPNRESQLRLDNPQRPTHTSHNVANLLGVERGWEIKQTRKA
jgi:hypothetical protein